MFKEEIISLSEDVSNSRLYSEDLAPVREQNRTWNTWALAALWIGMAVCIPTYILASYMIRSGLNWMEALIIILLANVIITIPMVLNGHAGVKYGIPFPVLGRAAFGINGVHFASILRAFVACGWFGVQTWIGGLALYAIFNAVMGTATEYDLTVGKFVCFFIFWMLNIYFVWKGTESIKWLEEYSAPILLLIGVILIGWGVIKADGFSIVLQQSKQLEFQAAEVVERNETLFLDIHPLTDKHGKLFKANEFAIISSPQLTNPENEEWFSVKENLSTPLAEVVSENSFLEGNSPIHIAFRKKTLHNQDALYSSVVSVSGVSKTDDKFWGKIWQYILWLTAMVGFWATMSISIADITRYAKNQKSQIIGQFLGLPGTMLLYSFVGVFVTCAAIINFDDILIANDAPWDPVSLLAKFESPIVVVIAQIFMIIATLSTNIAANIIAPANIFSNVYPKKISFKNGGIIAGVVGIAICPWWLLDEISGILVFISGLLGPVLGIMLADYYVLRRMKIPLAELYKEDGIFSYGGDGINHRAMFAFTVGVASALVGYWVPSLNFLYSLSWFTGFFLAFSIYIFLMKRSKHLQITN